ncbi:hypothetical protein LTR39_003076, partial [Cryomyces antarcticus]
FTKPAPTVADHGEDIPIPKIAQSQCDYEGELTIMIGQDAKDVLEEDALDYVAAYTAGNDVSARGWQREASKAGPVPQWSFSKSFDKYAPLGPCLVARDVLGAAENLSLKTLVNGKSKSDAAKRILDYDWDARRSRFVHEAAWLPERWRRGRSRHRRNWAVGNKMAFAK